MAQYRSPTPMNFDEPKWNTWRYQFMTFRLVTKLHNEENKEQVVSLKYCMGREAEEITKTFNMTNTFLLYFILLTSSFPLQRVGRFMRAFHLSLSWASSS